MKKVLFLYNFIFLLNRLKGLSPEKAHKNAFESAHKKTKQQIEELTNKLVQSL